MAAKERRAAKDLRRCGGGDLEKESRFPAARELRRVIAEFRWVMMELRRLLFGDTARGGDGQLMAGDGDREQTDASDIGLAGSVIRNPSLRVHVGLHGSACDCGS